MLMLIDTSEPGYGGGSNPSRRRMLAGGMALLVLAHFLPMVGGLLLAAAGLALLVLALYIVDDGTGSDA